MWTVLTLLLLSVGCTIETEAPAPPETPAGQASSAIERVKAESAAIETLLAEVEALTVTALNDPELREDALKTAEAKMQEIAEREKALDAALAEAEGLLEVGSAAE